MAGLIWQFSFDLCYFLGNGESAESRSEQGQATGRVSLARNPGMMTIDFLAALQKISHIAKIAKGIIGMDLTEKVILITGSSSGIGKATAIRFSQEGSRVIVNYHINRKGAEETREEIRKRGGKCLLVKADVSRPTEVDRLFQRAVDHFGTVDILINNAAIGTDPVPFMEAAYQDILKMINTDLISAMLCAQKAVRIMEPQGYGKILNTSSIRGWEHGGRAIVYSAAKAGINSFTRTLAKQVAPRIQVNAVAPGFVKTRSYEKMTQEMIDFFIGQTYLKRWISEEEVADTFVFLAKNDGITGQVIYVDGGFTLK
jgi:NAD(P)-dependent dehydrogenase (short-subunit alcohol dehydrogenase family)